MNVDDITTVTDHWHELVTLENADYDLNDDSVIDILDIVIVARNWGKRC